MARLFAGGGQRRGRERGVSSATSHVNIRLCVRYGGVRPVCMETKALSWWTTGVEPLVERPCLPTPWRTTLLYPLLPLPFSLRPLIAALLFSFSLPSLSAPSAAFTESHDSDSRHSLLERPGEGRIFRLRAKSINDGSARFYRWDRAGACSTP